MSQIVEEQEALKLACPYFVDRCKGSECMKWEWHYKKVPSHTPQGFVPAPNMLKTSKGSCGA